MSPDFRQRASSNASSVGRLSPIPSLGMEPDWNFGSAIPDYNLEGTTPTPQQKQQLDQLAGSLADELTLQTDFLQGSVFNESLENIFPCQFLKINYSPSYR